MTILLNWHSNRVLLVPKQLFVIKIEINEFIDLKFARITFLNTQVISLASIPQSGKPGFCT
jgi:hypothetical protein